MAAATASAAEALWVPDEWYRTCAVCDKAFTRTNRRHHCRCSGLVVCGACSPSEKIVPCPPVLLGAVRGSITQGELPQAKDRKKPQRVCVPCADVIDRVRSALPANESPLSERSIFAHRMFMVSHLQWPMRLELYRLAVLSSVAHGADAPTPTAGVDSSSGPSSPSANNNAPHTTDALLGIEPSSAQIAGPDLPGDVATRRHRRFTVTEASGLPEPSVDQLGRRVGGGRPQAISGVAQDRCRDLTARHQETLARHDQIVALDTVLQRHSMTTFFHTVFESLHSVVISNIMSLRNEHFAPGGKTAPLVIHGVPCTAHVPIFTLRLLAIIKLTEAAPATTICDRIGQLLIRATLPLAIRYQEQIVSLDETGAQTLAHTAVLRVLTHAQTARGDLSSLAALQDFISEAVLVECPEEFPAQQLQTRVPSIDSGWTDHGAFQHCGVRTSAGEYFDNVGTQKYYYRLGTRAEAVALNLAHVASRGVDNPITTAGELLRVRDGLMRMRNTSLAQYASANFAPPDQRAWASKESSSEPTQVKIMLGAIRSIRDFLSNRNRLLTTLIEQCHKTNDELNSINRRVNDVTMKLLDFVTDNARAVAAAPASESELIKQAIADLDLASSPPGNNAAAIESVGNLSQASSVALNSRRATRDYKMAMWNQFCDVILSSSEAPATFYVHLRTKLSAAMIGVLVYAHISEFEHLMGQPVMPTRELRSVAEAWLSEAGQNDTMRTWSYADIVDHHCDLIARAIAERHREQIARLRDAGVIAFAECSTARVVHLLSKNAAVRREVSSGKVVDLVRVLGTVNLADTVVMCSRVYLPQQQSAICLREHYLHVKAGLMRNEDGRRFVGHFHEARAAGLEPHHKPNKYGYLSVVGAELEDLAHLWLADDDGKPVEQAAYGSTASGKGKKNKKKVAPPVNNGSERPAHAETPGGAGGDLLAIRSRSTVNVFHWPLSLVSCGPTTLGVNETFGVTVRLRAHDGSHVPAKFTEPVVFRVITHRQSTVTQATTTAPLDGDSTSAGTSMSALQSSLAAFAARSSSGAMSPAVIRAGGSDHTTTYKVTAAGVCVVGAVYNSFMVVSNLVRIRPASASWDADRSSIRIEPTCVIAGAQMTARLILRDSYENIVTSMDADHFSLSIATDDSEITASAVKKQSDGAFLCAFRPIAAGNIRFAAQIGSYTLTYDDQSREPLLCVAGPTEFRNAVLTFDEYEVAPGVQVHGNLLLRDAFGNRVMGDEKDFDIELINGERVVLPRVFIQDGEYSFEFTPQRRGTATVRAVSRRTGDFIAARVDVVNSTDVDWSKCLVACITAEAFAGETLNFHFTLRDAFGNPVPDIDMDEITCRAFHPSTETEVDVSPITGVAPTFTFSATVEQATDVIGSVTVQGRTLQSPPVHLSPAALCWQRSKLTTPRVATVGEWIPVQIACKDRFGNPTPAHSGDFSVAASNEGFAGSAKTVEGGGSEFGFQFLGVHSGSANAVVTYAGHQEYVATVIMAPGPASWAHSQLTCELFPLRAGEDDLIITVSFSDQYGNRAFRVEPEQLGIRIENEGESQVVTDVIVEQQPRTPEERREDPLPTEAESRVVFKVRPTKAGHVQAFAKMDGLGEEKASPLASVVATHVSWERSSLQLADERAVAGIPLRAKLTLCDRFGNPSHKFLDTRLDDVYGDPVAPLPKPVEEEPAPVEEAKSFFAKVVEKVEETVEEKKEKEEPAPAAKPSSSFFSRVVAKVEAAVASSSSSSSAGEPAEPPAPEDEEKAEEEAVEEEEDDVEAAAAAEPGEEEDADASSAGSAPDGEQPRSASAKSASDAAEEKEESTPEDAAPAAEGGDRTSSAASTPRGDESNPDGEVVAPTADADAVVVAADDDDEPRAQSEDGDAAAVAVVEPVADEETPNRPTVPEEEPEEAVVESKYKPRGTERPLIAAVDAVSFRVVYTADEDAELVETEVDLEMAPSAEPNVFIVQTIPQVSRNLRMTATRRFDACPGREVVEALEDSKSAEITVGHNDMDWQYASSFTHAPAVIAGEPLHVVVSLHDAYGNTVPVSHAIALLQTPSVTSRTIPHYPDVWTVESASKHFSARATDAKGSTMTVSVTDTTNDDDSSAGDRPSLQPHQLLLTLRPTATGPAAISVACGDKAKTATTSRVEPAVHDWSQATLVWERTAVFAGLPCECLVEFRDSFGNLAANRCEPEDLSASCTSVVGDPNAVEFESEPTFEERGGRIFCVFTINKLGAYGLTVTMSGVDDAAVIAVPTAVFVDACEVSWPMVEVIPSCQLRSNVAAPYTDAPAAADDVASNDPAAANDQNANFVVAGEKGKFLIVLRDRYGNPAWRGTGSEQLRAEVHLVSGGGYCPVTLDAFKRAEPPTPGTDTPTTGSDVPAEKRVTTWIASSSVTKAGEYVFKVSSAVAPNEGQKTCSMSVGSAVVEWPQGCQWAIDAPQVTAGAELFFQLEATDRFGNPTSEGISPVQDRLTVDVLAVLDRGAKVPDGIEPPEEEGEPVALARNATLLVQPGSGNFALNFPSTVAGTVFLQARLEGFAAVLESEKMRVVADEPAWQGSALVPPSSSCVAGEPVGIAVSLCDRFRNELTPDMGAEQLSLVSAKATFVGDKTPLACDVVDTFHGVQGLWIVTTCTRSGAVEIAASHADSHAVLTCTVHIAPASIARSKGTLSGAASAVAGVEAQLSLTLEDEFGNLMAGTKPTDFTVLAEAVGAKKPVTCTVHNVKDKNGSRGTASGNFEIACTLTTAADTTIRVLCSSGQQQVVLATKEMRVHPAAPSASRTSLAIDARGGRTSAVAGEPFVLLLTLTDAYGNAVSDIPQDAVAVCANGAIRPICTITRDTSGVVPDAAAAAAPPTGGTSRARNADGRYQVTMSPTQAGSMVVEVQLAGTPGSAVKSQTINVDAAAMDWPSCGLSTAESRVTAGHDTAVMVMPKDRFGNPVQALASDFEAVLEYLNDNDQPLPEDEQPAAGHTAAFTGQQRALLTAEVVPPQPGRVQVKVTFIGDSKNPRCTSVMMCE